ncbi:MAG: response regulator transcription factor [Candidatus Latescibacteria bacterium]|nr:response regulator transcription factor [Candidatus Latescibacterota bacterium]
MEIRTIIVDDEPLAREELRFLLKPFPKIRIIAEASHGSEAVALIERTAPDLVFLDIQMPGMDGFQVVQKLILRGRPPILIFVTAYDQYALKAFEVNALDYLLKPVDSDRLEKTMSRVREQIEARMDLSEKLKQLLSSMDARPQPLSRLSVRREGRLVPVNVGDIVYARISDGEVTIATEEAEAITSYRTLDELESDLDPQTFLRVHRSFIANLSRIAEIIPWFAGTYRLKMNDGKGSEVPLSRARVKKLRKLLKW